MTAKTS